MKTLMTLLIAGAVATACFALPATAQTKAKDEAKIRALEEQLRTAVIARDVNAVMKVYVPGQSLVVFDVFPPRQYVGADAYRKDWEGFLAFFSGPITYEISDLSVAAGGTLGYGHSIQHVSGTSAKGTPIDLTVRVTDVYRKVKGNWLIEHEHISVPVDLFGSGQPDLSSKP